MHFGALRALNDDTVDVGEGFGMHVQEAMASGCVPMVTAGGATDDFINDQNALRINSAVIIQDLTSPEIFAIKPGDSLTMMGGHGTVLEPNVEDLTSKIQQLIQHAKREEVLEKLRNAPKTLHPWDNVADGYYELLSKIDLEKIPARYA